MKVFWLFNHPAPYKVDFFNLLGKSCELTVCFERHSEGDRNPSFYAEKAKNFKMLLPHSLPLGDFNNYTDLPIKEIKKNHYDVIVINGWSTLTEMRCISYLKKHNIPYVFAINGGVIRENEHSYKKSLKQKFLPGPLTIFHLTPIPQSISSTMGSTQLLSSSTPTPRFLKMRSSPSPLLRKRDIAKGKSSASKAMSFISTSVPSSKERTTWSY